MREVQADGAGEAFNGFESGAGVDDVLAVVFRQRAEGEAIADRLLVLGVDVVGIAGVDGDGEAGVGNGGGGDGLRFARFGPVVAIDRDGAALCECGQADDVEGKIALARRASASRRSWRGESCGIGSRAVSSVRPDTRWRR